MLQSAINSNGVREPQQAGTGGLQSQDEWGSHEAFDTPGTAAAALPGSIGGTYAQQGTSSGADWARPAAVSDRTASPEHDTKNKGPKWSGTGESHGTGDSKRADAKSAARRRGTDSSSAAKSEWDDDW